jgi:membrane-bound lytic murein transglycosylase MltF
MARRPGSIYLAVDSGIVYRERAVGSARQPERDAVPMKCSKFFRSLVLAVFLAALVPAVSSAVEGEASVTRVADIWTGDFDGMAERRVIRALVVHNKMFFFLDQGRPRGMTHDLLLEFEKFINEKLQTGTLKLKVLAVPVTRDNLLPSLLEGKGDIAAANLTITPERGQQVDFSDPFLKEVSEIVITGPGEPKLESLDDLSGREIHVRASSSYQESLQELNDTLKKAGKAPVNVVPADELFEDSDLLEMVNAGMIPGVVVDSHKAEFWEEIFDQITLHPDVAVGSGGEIAWAFRKKSPRLEALVNEFVKGHRKGTLMGNILFKRYLQTNKWARTATSPQELEKFNRTVELFRMYADQYGFDYLMTAALAYQESGLDQSKKSHVGAIGIMQLMPSTAADKNVGIPDIGNIENNIHAGNKYLRFLSSRYFDDPAIDPTNQTLLAFASYNAGPGRVARLRKEAAEMGLDPNVWFNNVEVVAAKRIGRETVQYVSNIYKYYVAYKFIVEKRAALEKAKDGIDPGPGSR